MIIPRVNLPQDILRISEVSRKSEEDGRTRNIMRDAWPRRVGKHDVRNKRINSLVYGIVKSGAVYGRGVARCNATGGESVEYAIMLYSRSKSTFLDFLRRTHFA